VEAGPYVRSSYHAADYTKKRPAFSLPVPFIQVIRLFNQA